MIAMNASEARAKLFPLIEQVNEELIPVVITSKAGNAVLISEGEWNSMRETAYLFSNPNNARTLLKSIEEMNSGQGQQYSMSELGKVIFGDGADEFLRSANEKQATSRKNRKRTVAARGGRTRTVKKRVARSK